MSTKLEKLDPDNWESLHNLAMAMYLDGQCYEFAAALNRGLGWPIIGLMAGNPAGIFPRHTVAQPANKKFWDVRGKLEEHEIAIPFCSSGESYPLKSVTLEDLRKVRPVAEEAIDRASLTAQALWPELPWKKGTFQGRTLAFMADLEKLCTKHGVWIRAPDPVAQIVLGKAYGDEGFVVSPTMTGDYFFDRVIGKSRKKG